MQYDIIFISTCCNHQHIFNLVDSVFEGNKLLSVSLIIINQEKSKIENLAFNEKTKVHVIEYGKMVNTSIARNIGIQYVIDNGLASAFVGFPDDDSTFDSSFFSEISLLIKKRDFRNFVIDVFCTGSKKPFRTVKYPNDTLLSRYDYNMVGAVNIILDFETFSKNSFFDVRFGVNAKYGAGEDGDYFIRAVDYKDFYYNSNLYNFHPSGDSKLEKLTYLKLRKRVVGYGKGVIALLCKHKMFKQATIVTFRALGGVAKYLIKFKLLIAFAYFESFWVRLFYLIKFYLTKFR